MPLTQTGNWRKTRSQIAVAVRQHPDADVTELRRQLKAERLAEHIKQVVDSAPPLNSEQGTYRCSAHERWRCVMRVNYRGAPSPQERPSNKPLDSAKNHSSTLRRGYQAYRGRDNLAAGCAT